MDPRDDPMSHRQSFGSNYHPCSQSRKMSIGVVVDSSAKIIPQKASLHVAREAPQHTANVTSGPGNPVEDTHKAASPHPLENQPEAPGQITSPWVSTRSFYHKVSSSEGIVHAMNVSRLPSNSNVPKPSLTGTNEAAATRSVHFFANQASILQSASVQQKKMDGVADQSMADKERATGREGEFAYAPANEALIPEKAAEGTNVPGNNGNGTLRMKLWEILGTVSSPIKQQSNSQTLEGGANDSKPEVEGKEKASSMIKSRQHSDTIETDSHSSDHTIGRPVTRSLTKKKPQAKVSLKKTKMAPLHRYRQAHLEENIFTFEAGWSERLHVASSKSKRETSERKSSRIDPYKMLFSEQKNADQTQGATDRMKRKQPSNSSLYGDRIEKPKNSDPVEPTNGLHQVSHHSPVVETGQLGDADEPTLEEHVTQREQFSNSSPNNILNSQYDLQSPGFELKTPIKNSSPSSSSNTNQGEAEDDSPAERAFDMDGTHSLEHFLQTKGGCYKANGKMGSSNHVRELGDSPVVKTVPIIKECQKNRLSGFPCEEGDPESSMDGSPITSYKETGSLSPEIETAEERKFVLRPAKKYRTQAGNEEINGVYGSEHNGEVGLASAVTLISFALERVKSKMDSMTRKRAAEILMSVSKKVYLQLQNAESQIETDVRKLTSLNKSKRKRLEIRFQEQQEQLKLIYERFNEEVNQHLQDCKSTLEGLEPQHTEFTGAAEKQKVSHRKLLLEAEEAIETQLDDCQRRITGVHKLARKKMLQLKYAIAECLKDGALS